MKAERKRTADMTRQERRTHRSWRQRIIGFVKPRVKPRGQVTEVNLNLRGATGIVRRLRLSGGLPVSPHAAKKFAAIHERRRLRNEARRSARTQP